MNISWFGHSSFKLSEKIDGKEVIVVTDPYGKDTGLFPPKISADVVTVSHDHFDHNNTEKVTGNQDEITTIIDRPGEYETKKVFINGIPSFHDKKNGSERGSNTIFKIEIDHIVVAHLGDLGQKLTEEQIDFLGDIDVLLIPVGGKYTIDGAEAAEVVRQIEPRMVIPMHYKIPGLTIDIDDEKKFLKEMGGKADKETKLKITRKDLPEDNIRVVILEKS
ncbi:hypothetical protein A2223_01890 [Candidatus Falkowbacteria bacterium RIFOXYA2_FULL_35_8]|uniref:Lactamase n=1 Tax=Candidatus Falkowbacteria bacterium RIFOXYC2_FULL_36_12 TaxID=1798002 RepID=A0A1F5T360_9BACT|nr:MAG: hypothetical protein A2300_04335 [Candidatus Falkowbacteria bacterium RIFOXYB2_FULL_35_7]OGF33352.1 MAG: hypothetical protein A2478_01470 [Candidatus Falkowbacteria bacterium RIFOXYC2_FULL_36_12]OGF33973.1 MAG: hypothetical protein A2223_01890 [Candidatus Falkowbacteria bacterium RIFOXYA2_FULL_35_8]